MTGTSAGKSLSETYHENADPEKDSAKRLADSLEPWRYSVPPGPILEIGSGTGIFTSHLRRILPKRSILITDTSKEILAKAEENLGKEVDDGLLNFSQFDAEKNEIEDQKYALICGNHVVHQFENPPATLEKLALGLKIDGLMLMSFPGEDSFQEWKSACVELGIPYTGQSMPGTESLVIHLSMGPVQVDFYEDQSTWYFENFEAFRAQMLSGGLKIEKDDKQLAENEIRLLNENWKKTSSGTIALTYHNVFLAVKRIGE